MERLGGQASGATSEIARARNAAIERGEKLGQLDIQTQEMMEQSKNLSKTAAMLAAKYEKQDKWWGVWPRWLEDHLRGGHPPPFDQDLPYKITHLLKSPSYTFLYKEDYSEFHIL